MYSFIILGSYVDEDLSVHLSGPELIVYAYFYNASGANNFRVRTHDIDYFYPDLRRWLTLLLRTDCFDIEMLIDKLMSIGCFEETPDGFKVVDLRTINENE